MYIQFPYTAFEKLANKDTPFLPKWTWNKQVQCHILTLMNGFHFIYQSLYLTLDKIVLQVHA